MKSCNEAQWANCGVIWHLLTSENVLATTDRERNREGGVMIPAWFLNEAHAWCLTEPGTHAGWNENKNTDPVTEQSITFVVFVISFVTAWSMGVV